MSIDPTRSRKLRKYLYTGLTRTKYRSQQAGQQLLPDQNEFSPTNLIDGYFRMAKNCVDYGAPTLTFVRTK